MHQYTPCLMVYFSFFVFSGELYTHIHHVQWCKFSVFTSHILAFPRCKHSYFVCCFNLSPFYLFQCVLLGMYQAMMQEVVDSIVDFGGFSVQSVQGDTRTHLFLKGWKGDSPFCVCIGTFDKFTKFPLGELSSLAGLFSCFAKPVASVATINLPPHLGKALDHSSSAKTSTLNIPVFSFKEFCDVLRTPTSSVLGKADLFGLLDYIVIKLRSAAAEPWILDSTHLRIVSCPSSLYVRFYAFICL